MMKQDMLFMTISISLLIKDLLTSFISLCGLQKEFRLRSTWPTCMVSVPSWLYSLARSHIRGICDGCYDLSVASEEELVDYIRRDSKEEVDDEEDEDDNWMDA